MGRGTAVVTGASSGIGAATAGRLASEGYDLVIGARRTELLEEVAEPIGARALHLDVADADSVERFCSEVPDCRLLVNNAGGALDLDPVSEADDERWLATYESNVLGAVRMTRRLLPALIDSGDGHVITVGSIAGIEAYPGGGGYNAAKFAIHGVMEVLRMELVDQPVRVSEIAPGMVDTGFSVVRFGGDEERAAQVYEGMTPLTAEDIADCIAWVATRPAHVNVAHVLVLPRDQATATRVHRTTDG